MFCFISVSVSITSLADFFVAPFNGIFALVALKWHQEPIFGKPRQEFRRKRDDNALKGTVGEPRVP